jgi:hypothetical protein
LGSNRRSRFQNSTLHRGLSSNDRFLLVTLGVSRVDNGIIIVILQTTSFLDPIVFLPNNIIVSTILIKLII